MDWVQVRLIHLSIVLGIQLLILIPVSYYYDWKDPLIKDDELVEHATSEATLRRLKYKKKIKNWRKMYT